jgi:hypothetical protein
MFDAAHNWFLANGFSGIGAEERACLEDPARLDEAIDMVNDWEDRVGLPSELRGNLVSALLDAAGIES